MTDSIASPEGGRLLIAIPANNADVQMIGSEQNFGMHMSHYPALNQFFHASWDPVAHLLQYPDLTAANGGLSRMRVRPPANFRLFRCSGEVFDLEYLENLIQGNLPYSIYGITALP